MSDQRSQTNDQQLAELFQILDASCPDDGFTELVMHRVGRRLRWRRTILVSAAIIGGALALLPLLHLTVGFFEALTEFALRWNDVEWLKGHKEVLLATLVALTVPLTVRLLD